MKDPNLFIKSGNAIYNDDIRVFLENNIKNYFSTEHYAKMDCQEEYCSTFIKWIQSSKNNKIEGLESFSKSVVSLGVTQSLDTFHYEILNSKRRLRLFRGEYPYNRDVHHFSFATDFLDDQPLVKGDAVVLSCPFSGSGNIHPRMNFILNKAEELDVPVFIDMAWYGTCANLNVNLNHPAIKYVAFSLTKGLTCGNYRSGIRLSRNLENDRMILQQEWHHGIHLNVKIGIELMKNFGPDTQFEKYKLLQLAICEKFNLVPSLCVHIATGGYEWRDYHRDGGYNRVNLREAIKKFRSSCEGE